MTDVTFWQAVLWLAAWFGTAALLCAAWHGAVRLAGRIVERDVYRALNHSTTWDASDRAAWEAADRVPDPERPADEAGGALGLGEYPTREDRP